MAKRTVSAIADEIFDLNTKLKNLNAEAKKIEEEKRILEQELIAECETLGLEKGGGKTSKFTITPSVVPVVSAENWDKFYKFIKRNNWFHLLERRPSLTGCRELWEQNKDIPGVDKFTKMKVTVSGA